MNSYQQRKNAERLERQAPAVKAAAKMILEQQKSIEQYLYWSFDPEENPAYYSQNLLDYAHELVDLAHEFRAAVKANPPPQEEDEHGDDAA